MKKGIHIKSHHITLLPSIHLFSVIVVSRLMHDIADDLSFHLGLRILLSLLGASSRIRVEIHTYDSISFGR